jgi:hypothetical protein
MRYPKRHSLLFRLACEGLRLTLLLFAAFIAACLVLAPFGGIAWSEELIPDGLAILYPFGRAVAERIGDRDRLRIGDLGPASR